MVGGFNGWDLRRGSMEDADDDGLWETVLEVDPGEWRYAFVVDGRWIRPKDAGRYEEDGFGGVNGILEVLGERRTGEAGGDQVTPNADGRPTERTEG